MMSYPKTLIMLLLMTGGWMVSRAQAGRYFIYLQSDQQQLFYVKTGNKLLSSSPAGYLIIPGIKPGKTMLVVGFPRNEYPEQRFMVDLNQNRDKGFLLKKTGSRFALYNLANFQKIPGTEGQSQAGVTTSAGEEEKLLSPKGNSGSGKDSIPSARGKRFRDLLARVTHENLPPPGSGPVSDSAVLTPKAGPSLATRDSSLAIQIHGASPESRQPARVKDTLLAAQGSTATAIIGDTATVYTPAAGTGDSGLSVARAGSLPPVSGDLSDSLAGGGVPSPAAQSARPQFIHFSGINPRNTAAGRSGSRQGTAILSPSTENSTASAALPMINSDCKSQISDKKFIRVRMKIALRDTPERMILTAGKYFSQYCYTVDQIQSLALLFNSDKYRFRLLDLAYPHTYDSGRFSRLERVLSNSGYRSRFMAMLHK